VKAQSCARARGQRRTRAAQALDEAAWHGANIGTPAGEHSRQRMHWGWAALTLNKTVGSPAASQAQGENTRKERPRTG
jgi:hypothetical protein